MTIEIDDGSFTPKPGDVVKHYKGNLYIVLLLADDEVTGETRVIYTECDPPKNRKQRTWDRTLKHWCEWARADNGAKVPRYMNVRLAGTKRRRA